MLACGVLGFFMRIYGLSPAALVIALVLGPLAEESLRQTMVISGGGLGVFLERGTSVGILCFIVFLFMIPVLKTPIRRASQSALHLVSRHKRETTDDDAENRSEREHV